jgi:hypothetical protein
MFRFYSILKSQRPEGHITEEEVNVASGRRLLTTEASAEFLGGLEAQSENIKKAFAKQQEQEAVCLHCALSMPLILTSFRREHGIRDGSRAFSPSGSSPPISPLIRLIIQSLRN